MLLSELEFLTLIQGNKKFRLSQFEFMLDTVENTFEIFIRIGVIVFVRQITEESYVSDSVVCPVGS